MDWKALGLIGIAASAAGCMDMDFSFDQIKGSGKQATEHRTVGNFNKIDMRGAFDVDVKVGPSTSVTVSGDDNLVKIVEAKVDNGTLILSTNKKSINPVKPLRVAVTTPNLAAFTLKGAGDANLQGIHNSDFSLDLSGAGDVTASGEADTLSTSLSGAGDMKLFDLHAKDVTAKLDGAGDMKVWASRALDAKVSGVGDLTYKGHPASVRQSKSGVGDISAAD